MLNNHVVLDNFPDLVTSMKINNDEIPPTIQFTFGENKDKFANSDGEMQKFEAILENGLQTNVEKQPLEEKLETYPSNHISNVVENSTFGNDVTETKKLISRTTLNHSMKKLFLTQELWAILTLQRCSSQGPYSIIP